MILFVINTNSGNGRGKKIWLKVEAQLRRRGTKYVQVVTSSETEANSLVSKHLEHGNIKSVAVIGGDGTLHSLLPLLATSGISYGLIPSGSGNDTSRALGIPRNPIKALEIILAGHTKQIDLLETITQNGIKQLSITAIAIGLDAAVANDVNDYSYKKWCNKLYVGSLAYVIGLLRALAKFKPASLTLTVDGVSHQFNKGWLSAVTNVSTYGGGLKICPTALPDDGHLHVCVVHGCTVRRILFLFPSVLWGGHVKQHRFVTFLSGHTVTIKSSTSLLSFGDGEPIGETPITAVIRPRQLDFLISASG
ncbi:diacylglycerol kinase family protein [Cohnella sp. WQ 127256]|uniref:diacylglycerol/lipid kinase family protein n=1 Tax=Cohnella sp. WQ 127256 TaxID=2938790 RepID=UPI0021189EA0|nr:diacylglycerol kinase family protein [Cohnella sp. WQ 127256]